MFTRKLKEGVMRMIGKALLSGKYQYIKGSKIIKYADVDKIVCQYFFKVKNLRTKKIERIKVEAVYDFGVKSLPPKEFWYLLCGR